MDINLILNITIIFISFFTILIFARKSATYYNHALELVQHHNEFYTELILGLESVGQNVCKPNLLAREVRIAIWELFNNLRVQPTKENKIIALKRKMLSYRPPLYKNLEEGKVLLEILPFLGIIGTLMGFAVPYFFNQALKTVSDKTFNITGFGFFLAASSTIFALFALIYLKKKYEARVLAKFDYFESQEKALEQIMVDCDGFNIFEEWLSKWPNASDIEKKAAQQVIPEKNWGPHGLEDFID